MTAHFLARPAVMSPACCMPFCGFDNRSARRDGGLHLTLRLGNVRICYAYIRKNGCSSFKSALGYPPETRISVIARQHRARWYHRHDATIFVWRDPEERLISLYRNKILDRRGGEDICRRYRDAMGEDPSSFEKFTEFAMLFSDPHCLPQSHHLGPYVYTHAIALHRLHESMQWIAGPAVARAFARPVNMSLSTPVEVTPRARQLIRWAYADDYRLIAALG